MFRDGAHARDNCSNDVLGAGTHCFSVFDVDMLCGIVHLYFTVEYIRVDSQQSQFLTDGAFNQKTTVVVKGVVDKGLSNTIL